MKHDSWHEAELSRSLNWHVMHAACSHSWHLWCDMMLQTYNLLSTVLYLPWCVPPCRRVLVVSTCHTRAPPPTVCLQTSSTPSPPWPPLAPWAPSGSGGAWTPSAASSPPSPSLAPGARAIPRLSQTDGSDRLGRPRDLPRHRCSCRAGPGLTGRCSCSHSDSLSADLSMGSSHPGLLNNSYVTCEDAKKFLLFDNFWDRHELPMVLMTLK